MIALCLITAVIDADTVKATCNGKPQTIRLAAISGLERNGSCNSSPWCPTMPFARAKAIATRIMLGNTYRFTIHGRSGKRLVGNNDALRCTLQATGAVVSWESYRVRYKLRRCPA